MQGEPDSRMLPDELMSWFVRGTSNSSANPNMVPLSAVAKGVWAYGTPQLLRYNGVPAIEILGQPGPGHSTGEAMKEIEQLATKLPAGIGLSWTGLSYEEVQSGSNSTYAYGLALTVVFLSLAALYESWSIPLAVMLVVPLGAIGAVVATWTRGLADDIYFQVGLLVIIGLSAKNAILIVQFAKQGFDEGKTAVTAALEASLQRLRPILMTSLAFILGVLPLAIATGAGSGSENAIGTGVVGGMIGATFLAIFFVPVFFVLVMKLFRAEPGHPGAVDEEP
jgi:multidrug efflux pump